MRLLCKCSKIKLGTIPLLKGSETKHLLITGATGIGKTNALRMLLKAIRMQGDQVVIVGTTGDFVANFYREEKDFLLNPYDQRSKEWDPWRECTHDYEYEELVNSFIPKSDHLHDDFFKEASRDIILAALKKHQEHDAQNIKDLVNDLILKNSSELYREFEDTPSKIYLDPHG